MVAKPNWQIVDEGRTEKGGFTRQQLELWGVEWPPQKGWRKRLEKQKEPLPEPKQQLRASILNPGWKPKPDIQPRPISDVHTGAPPPWED